MYYTILYYTMLCYTILYYAMLYYTILYYTILYYTLLYYTILYSTILYYTIPCYAILCYTIPSCASCCLVQGRPKGSRAPKRRQKQKPGFPEPPLLGARRSLSSRGSYHTPKRSQGYQGLGSQIRLKLSRASWALWIGTASPSWPLLGSLPKGPNVVPSWVVYNNP